MVRVDPCKPTFSSQFPVKLDRGYSVGANKMQTLFDIQEYNDLCITDEYRMNFVTPSAELSYSDGEITADISADRREVFEV